ncbi:Carbonic anhydrase [uncultured archaeon]|nr:Carbonic anhydrase [uncultured archaeon]
MNAEESLNKLKEGNARFVSGKPSHKDMAKRRAELVSGQKPYAIILTCSDNRVSPEHIFDAGLGEIFVVRNAGNLASPIALGSIEYAAEHLGSPLLVVMGHSSCGAVNAACAADTAPGNIGLIVKEIQEAVKAGKKDQAQTVIENVKCVLKTIRAKSSILSHLEKEGKLKIIGAVYSLQTGEAKPIA